MKTRRFKPAKRFIGNTVIETKVKEYIWTSSKGLYVIFKDGLKFKSDYTLSELLKSKSESVVEIFE